MNFNQLVGFLPVARIFLSFAFLYAVMFADFIRCYSTAGPYCTSDECTFTAAYKSAYDSSARCRTANDLCRVVMAFIMSILFPLRLAMLFPGLCQRKYRLEENGGEGSVDCNCFEFRHRFTSLQGQTQCLEV
jgi:hypothetical protein